MTVGSPLVSFFCISASMTSLYETDIRKMSASQTKVTPRGTTFGGPSSARTEPLAETSVAAIVAAQSQCRCFIGRL